MRKSLVGWMGLAVVVSALLAGCGGPEEKGVPVGPRWKGAPYRIAFDAKAGKPNAAGVTLPAVKFTANPEALETRALLIMRFAGAGPKDKEPVMHRMIGAPVDLKGEEGTLPADYMDRANKGLAEYLGSYCVQGPVKLSVALARSSLSPLAGDAEVDAKRLSDWLSTDFVFKNPHPKKC